MIDFGTLILAHMLGDYIGQNDWMANGKVKKPIPPDYEPEPALPEHVQRQMQRDRERQQEATRKANKKGIWACAAHVVVYTLCFVAMTQAQWPPWAYAVIALTHYPIDRYRLAAWWMENVSRQQGFKDNMGPWSVIIIDNTAHLLCAWFTWKAVLALGG